MLATKHEMFPLIYVKTIVKSDNIVSRADVVELKSD